MDKLAAKSLCIERDQVTQAVNALKAFVEKKSEVSAKKSLISVEDEEAIQMQFSYKKIPKIERKNVNVVLPHPTVHPKTTSVCLFVKDLVKTREYEKTVRKYTEIFASRGVTQDIEFLPLKRLKLEFTDFEAKRNLSNSYDIFLADARIIRLLPALLGKHFIGHHKFPLQVRLDSKNLNSEIMKALGTSQCILSGKGSTCQMTIGVVSQTDSQLVDNIYACLKALSAEVPGGSANIRNIVLKTHSSKALPIYLSLGSKEEVILPKQTRKREATKMEEVTTVIDAKVSVNKSGIVKLKSSTAKKPKLAKSS